MATVAEHFGDPDWFATDKPDSEATTVFRLMEDTDVGVTLTYDDFDRVLGRDFKSNRQPWNTALRRWHAEKPNAGTWVNVQRVGYMRVAEWDEVKGAGKAHESRMRKQARKSKTRYRSADPSVMSDDQKREQSDLLVRVGKLEQAMRSTKKEIAVLKKTKANVTDVDDLRDQLAALTKKINDASS